MSSMSHILSLETRLNIPRKNVVERAKILQNWFILGVILLVNILK
jgi:hypothetical protein